MYHSTLTVWSYTSSAQQCQSDTNTGVLYLFQHHVSSLTAQKMKDQELEIQLEHIEGTGHPRTFHEGPEGKYRYSSTLSLILSLYVGGRSTPRPGSFTHGKESRYPFYRRLSGRRTRLDWCGKSRPHWNSIPGLSSQYRVAVPTEPSWPTKYILEIILIINVKL